MKYSLFVCLIAVGLTIVAPLSCAQTPAMQQGVSVQMAASRNAVAFPAADEEDAWIVAITTEGQLYFGIRPITPDELLQEMRIAPRNREAKLYLKCDARTAYANVARALDAARHDLFQSAVLLTLQREPYAGAIAPPEGLEVGIVPPSRPVSAIVQLFSSGEGSPALKINGEAATFASLESNLNRVLQHRSEKVVLVQVDGRLSFADVVHAIDICRSMGATVVLYGSEV